MSDLLPVVLASQSGIRRSVLTAAGVAFDAQSPSVDEDAVKTEMQGKPPAAIALALAEKKALAVSATRDGLVIGADQVLVFDGAIWDKARSMQEAEERLAVLRGKTHELVCGLAIAHGGDIVWRHGQTSRLTMRNYSDAFLARYLHEAGEAILTSVGCYQLEGLGAQLFESIEGDYFAVLGMPLLPLLAALRDHGGLEA